MPMWLCSWWLSSWLPQRPHRRVVSWNDGEKNSWLVDICNDLIKWNIDCVLPLSRRNVFPCCEYSVFSIYVYIWCDWRVVEIRWIHQSVGCRKWKEFDWIQILSDTHFSLRFRSFTWNFIATSKWTGRQTDTNSTSTGSTLDLSILSLAAKMERVNRHYILNR